MNQEEWKNYKRNCISKVWYWLNASWIYELLNFPFLFFLRKQKWGKTFYRGYLKLRFFVTKKPVFGLLEYLVTSHCTLNCKHCNTKIPYFTNETHTRITTFEEFKEDIDNLLASTDFINILGFVGGEPLLAKDLAKMIIYASAKRQIKQIFIATNGTILPNEELIKAMKHPKVAVQLSDYSHIKIYKKHVTVKYLEMKALFIEKGIKFNNFQEKRGAQTWFSMPDVYKDLQSKKIAEKNWNECCINVNMMCEGYLLPCTIAPSIIKNHELIDEIKNELVYVRNINSKEELRKKLIKYFCMPYSSFCHYCHFGNIKTGLLCGEQVEEDNGSIE